MIWIYFVAITITIGSLQLLSQQAWIDSTFKRTIAGTTTSTASYGWLSAYTGFESYIRACLEGEFGAGGYFMFASLIGLLGVWIWNIAVTRQYIVR